MFRLVKFGVKAGIASSAVYLTVDSGVWKDSVTTTELYNTLQDEIRPYVRPYIDLIPFEIPKLPQAGDIVSSCKSAWNKGVLAASLFLCEVPDIACGYTTQGAKYVYEKIVDELAVSGSSQENVTKET